MDFCRWFGREHDGVSKVIISSSAAAPTASSSRWVTSLHALQNLFYLRLTRAMFQGTKQQKLQLDRILWGVMTQYLLSAIEQ